MKKALTTVSSIRLSVKYSNLKAQWKVGGYHSISKRWEWPWIAYTIRIRLLITWLANPHTPQNTNLKETIMPNEKALLNQLNEIDPTGGLSGLLQRLQADQSISPQLKQNMWSRALVEAQRRKNELQQQNQMGMVYGRLQGLPFNYRPTNPRLMIGSIILVFH